MPDRWYPKKANARENLPKKKVIQRSRCFRKTGDKILEEILLDILPQAFAVVKETCRKVYRKSIFNSDGYRARWELATKNRFVKIEGDKSHMGKWVDRRWWWLIKWNMVPYDVQLIGGTALHEGKIAEMATGEGRTLVSTIASLPQWSKVVWESTSSRSMTTWRNGIVNGWGPIHEFLLLKVDCIDKHQPNSAARKMLTWQILRMVPIVNLALITLRDNMVSLDELVQRKHHFAMVMG